MKKNKKYQYENFRFSAAKGEEVDLFVYGTLVNDNYVQLLINRKVESVPARLNHYMRLSPKGGYPFIIKHHEASTFGRVLKGITKDELKRIDKFEDEGVLYNRRTVVVRTRPDGHRQRCMTYAGNISNISQLTSAISQSLHFEDRYSFYMEKKIDEILADLPSDRDDINRRVLRELMSSEVDSIIQSHFDGNYICNYIMIQALEDAKPPKLSNVLKKKDLVPYAGNYMNLACKHIVLNQFAYIVHHKFADAVRVSRQYFRHGVALLIAFIFYNRKKNKIEELFAENKLDRIVEGRSYRDYAAITVDIVDLLFKRDEIYEIVDYVRKNWYASETPLGAELEFSDYGSQAVTLDRDVDTAYDGFFWFRDFDMFRRTWRVGGHVDSHRHITVGQKRYRGFFEYALGRYQIIGDLSRPLFACPWALSRIINEAVKFLDIAPHSLHISMELEGGHSNITDQKHKNGDLACLLMLGGELRKDEEGKLREWRVYNNELDTNFRKSLNFCDRKYHFSKPQQDPEEASEVMEYKFFRLHEGEFDYEEIIFALKGYQSKTHGRAISILNDEKEFRELSEHRFIRKWARSPKPLNDQDICGFMSTVAGGLEEENKRGYLSSHEHKILEKIEKKIRRQNEYIRENI